MEAYGFLGAIVARRDPANPDGPLQIVFGHRRVEAALRASIPKIPVSVAEVSDEDVRRLALLENDTHKPLNLWEEARWVERAVRETGWSLQQLADHLGKAKSWVQVRWDLMRVPPDVRDAAEHTGSASPTALITINRMPPDEREAGFTRVRGGDAPRVDDLRHTQALRRRLAGGRRGPKALGSRSEPDPADGATDVAPATAPDAARIPAEQPADQESTGEGSDSGARRLLADAANKKFLDVAEAELARLAQLRAAAEPGALTTSDRRRWRACRDAMARLFDGG